MTLFEQLKKLFDAELYSDIRILAELVLPMCSHSEEMLTNSEKYQLMVYYADALYHTKDFKKAECFYRKALHVRKEINKMRGKQMPSDLISDVEVKFKIHLCHKALKQWREAISVLESINSKQRTARVNMALATLYQQIGNDRSSVTCYKEVLRECPLAVDAMRGLLSLGIKGADVSSLVSHSAGHTEWLSLWIRAKANTSARDYTSAISALRNLNSKFSLHDCPETLSSLAMNYLYSGETTLATKLLLQVHDMDPLYTKHMDTMAYLLMKDMKLKQLESRASQLMAANDNASESWVAMGYYCLINKEPTKAVYFAHKGCLLNPRNVEALLLKGYGLLDLKKPVVANEHFREALKVAPYRYECHKGIIDSYLSNQKAREAVVAAGYAYKQLGNNARSLTLYASVLAKDSIPVTADKAKTYLEKALKLDPEHLEAVYCLAHIFYTQDLFDKGIELLKRQLQRQRTAKLHQLLGDFLSRTAEKQEALEQYSLALKIEPGNAAATEGLERLEKQSDISFETGYDMEGEDMEAGDNVENDFDFSDMESAWSVTDATDFT